jgi:uncharacterized protein YgbK (DUF1537 family)
MTGRKPKILVLADDLTGAAEIGGIAFLFGLSVRILLGRGKDEAVGEDVTIIETASRSFAAQRAHRVIREMISGHELADFDLVFKKVDSVLRGPVVAEARAFLAEPAFRSVLLVPANPSKGRTIRDGRYFIAGKPVHETEFGLDPMHPIMSSSIREMLDCDESVVAGGGTALAAEGKIIVPDTGSEAEIVRLLEEAELSQVLPAGGSDFFRIILSFVLHLRPIREPVPFAKPENCHFIIGSNSKNSIGTVRRLQEIGYVAFELPVNAIRNESLFTEWAREIQDTVKRGMNVVVSGPFGTINNRDGAGKISGLIARAAKVVADLAPPGTHLCLEGGESASGFFRTMGWEQAIVSQVLDVGVVTLQPEGADVQITVKPGSYRWPENLID